MVFIKKAAKTVRNHWKKSIFFSSVAVYGTIYLRNYMETQELMRSYCEKAAKYGKKPLPIHLKPRHVTVILNPNANKRKANKEFDKYCAPLLHLAGISVEIRKTESEGHAKTLVEELTGTDALVIAGGDGTLSEVITGLMRRNDDRDNGVPIGVLPLGRTNSFAKIQFPWRKKTEKVKALAESTMAVIEESIRPLDVMKIEVISSENSTEEDSKEAGKPVYAVSSLKWGAYRDAEAKKDNYWVFGPFRNYATYVFNGLKSKLSWNCEAQISYSPPCDGCSNCFKRTDSSSNGGGFFSKFAKPDPLQFSKLSVNNPECSVSREKTVRTADLSLTTLNSAPETATSPAKLLMRIGPDSVAYLDFVRNGFRLEKGENSDVTEVIEAKTVDIRPENAKQSAWFSIDSEDFEVRPVKVTLLPRIIRVFCKKESASACA
ncbi:unnamed protein product [Phyllotreta striolata]|uniref:Acylglycerol kinase, mitochondrial n=1 Tax=Phyllotreta striolata TaxID=444603 RepID=A0A9N9TM99_PHYSR|nr:unnamed protein product [Phyllotreta striolata]